MKKLGKLVIDPEKLMKNAELVNEDMMKLKE